jgi:hypothetical protein
MCFKELTKRLSRKKNTDKLVSCFPAPLRNHPLMRIYGLNCILLDVVYIIRSGKKCQEGKRANKREKIKEKK